MRLIHGVPGWGSPLLGPQLPRGPPQLSAACRCGNSLRGKRETSVALSASFPLPLEALLRDPSGSFLGPDSRIAVPEPCSGSPAGSICFRILLGVVCHLLQAGLDGAVGWSPRQLACPETLLPPGPRVRTSPGQGSHALRGRGRSLVLGRLWPGCPQGKETAGPAADGAAETSVSLGDSWCQPPSLGHKGLVSAGSGLQSPRAWPRRAPPDAPAPVSVRTRVPGGPATCSVPLPGGPQIYR